MNLDHLNQIPTMSSLEIAKLTGKHHFHVLRDIEEQLGSLEGGVSRFGDTYKNAQNNQSYRIYRLPKRETLILVSGYSIELRTKIIDRWQQLEKQAVAHKATSEDPKYLVARALIAAAGMIEEKDAQIAELIPRAEFADQVSDSETVFSFNEVCKRLSLDIGSKRLFDYCRKKGILMPSNEPYQIYVDKGLLRTVLTPYTKPNGTKHIGSKPVFTGEGLIWISEQLRKDGHEFTYSK